MTLDNKSPQPLCFGVQETLWMITVPNTGVFSDRVLESVFYTKCIEEEFVIGQMLRTSGGVCIEWYRESVCRFLPTIFKTVFPTSGFRQVPSVVLFLKNER